ncbi:hypothetical protein R1sor_025614 [Riccia sorocarpa]|uniref:Uncharacterized protein n=1 Tax=Riccia sorocarpa TaxID=122646 RepID=A0ABD3GAG3_9MARC
MATVWATGVTLPVINGQGLGVRAAAGKKQPAKGGRQQPQVQKSEKGFLDRVLEWMDKESFSETDPVLRGDDKGFMAPWTGI